MSAGDHLNRDQFDGPVYLRFGDWPENERSRNHATGDLEFGVSVYDIDHKTESGDTYGDMMNRVERWRKGREPGHLVTGEEAGIGHDGEPLLNKVKRLGAWEGPR